MHRGEPQCAGKAGGAEEFQTEGLHGAKYGVDRLGKNKSKTKGKFALSMMLIIAAKEPMSVHLVYNHWIRLCSGGTRQSAGIRGLPIHNRTQ